VSKIDVVQNNSEITFANVRVQHVWCRRTARRA